MTGPAASAVSPLSALERIADVVTMCDHVGGVFAAATLAYSGLPAALGSKAAAEVTHRYGHREPLGREELLDVVSEQLCRLLMVEVAAAAALVRLLAEELARRDSVDVVAVLRECMDAAREVLRGD